MPPKKTEAAETKTKTKEEAPKRVKLSELPQKEKDAHAETAIRELYKTSDQGEKRKIRARLRNIDENWTETYAKLIERVAPAPEPKAKAEGKKSKKKDADEDGE